jgi:putative flippase GtrA
MAKYVLIGILCFVIDFSIFLILTDFVESLYLYASATGYLTGAVVNYIFCIKWVFPKRNLANYWKTEFGIFIAIEFTALLVLTACLYIFADIIDIDLELSKILANIVAGVWNYIIKRLFLFDDNSKLMQYIKRKRGQGE